MSRRSRSSEDTFTLFPFLAVLLCTMGSLTMIFVAVAQQGSDAPAEEIESNADVSFDPEHGLAEISQYGTVISANTLVETLARDELVKREPKMSSLEDLNESTSPEPEDEFERAKRLAGNMTFDEVIGEKESVEWFIDEMAAVRERTEKSLQSERERLATAETSLAKLTSNAETLKRKLEALTQSPDSNDNQDALALQEEINSVDAKIDQLKLDVDLLRKRNQNGNRSYSILPYQGKKGTFRRPIYVECTGNGVYLQPEGILFKESDFLLGRFPGNPFDRGLRVAARHYLETDGATTSSGDKVEPYPLLIVRPSGAPYFYAALSALSSWGDLYGYEFVEEDQAIEYPEADPTLKSLAQQQIDNSRRALEPQLAALVSSRNAANRYYSFQGDYASGVPLNNGVGVSSELQSRLGTNARIGVAKVSEDKKQRVPSGPNAGGSEVGSTLETSIATTNERPGDSTWNPTYNGAFAQYAISGANGQASPNGAGTNVVPSASNPNSNGGASNGSNIQANALASAQNSALNSGNIPDGVSTQNSARPQGSVAQTSNGASSPSNTNAPGYMANMIAPNGASSSNEKGSVDLRKTLGNTTYASGANGVSDFGTLTDAPQKDSDSDAASSGSLAIEKRLDKDNATPKEAFRLSQEKPVNSGIERGILVRCTSKAIVFPKQAGVRATTTVRADSQVIEQELLDAVSFCIKSWGLAGRNAYWAPFIKVEISEGGEEQFAQLSEFCKSQGLSITLVKPDVTIK